MFEMYPSGKKIEEAFEQAEKDVNDLFKKEALWLEKETNGEVEKEDIELLKVNLKDYIKNENVLSAVARFKEEDGKSGEILLYHLKLKSKEDPLDMLNKIFRRYHLEKDSHSNFSYGLIVKIGENLVSAGINDEDQVFFRMQNSAILTNSEEVAKFMSGLEPRFMLPKGYGNEILEYIKKNSLKIEDWYKKRGKTQQELDQLSEDIGKIINEPNKKLFKVANRLGSDVYDRGYIEVKGVKFMADFEIEGVNEIKNADITIKSMEGPKYHVKYNTDIWLAEREEPIRFVEYGKTLRKSHPVGFFYSIKEHGSLSIYQNPGEDLAVDFDNPNAFDRFAGDKDE